MEVYCCSHCSQSAGFGDRKEATGVKRRRKLEASMVNYSSFQMEILLNSITLSTADAFDTSRLVADRQREIITSTVSRRDVSPFYSTALLSSTFQGRPSQRDLKRALAESPSPPSPASTPLYHTPLHIRSALPIDTNAKPSATRPVSYNGIAPPSYEAISGSYYSQQPA